jgi:galactose mutarotase-like enzyme
MRRDVPGLRQPEAEVRLSSEVLEVMVLPAHGGKIISLRHKASGREWLTQPAHPLHVPPAYGSSFTATDLCGWDEMLPTITACRYPSPDPARRVSLPDHGEVWALEWKVLRSASDSVLMAVDGQALPYRLERHVSLAGHRMRLAYQVTATSSEPLWLLWAAHPQFACTGGTRVVLPRHVRNLLDVTVPGKPSRRAWPGEAPDNVDSLVRGEGRKLYVTPDTAVSWAALADVDGNWLRMSWDSATVPYLGIWLDNHAYAREPVAALEPSTGFYDDLALAQRSGRVPRVHAGAQHRWWVEVTAGTGKPALARVL